MFVVIYPLRGFSDESSIKGCGFHRPYPAPVKEFLFLKKTWLEARPRVAADLEHYLTAVSDSALTLGQRIGAFENGFLARPKRPQGFR